LKDTFYTSIHYLVKPNNPNAVVCCEIQVRTLFEEIWGEIDHTINYPFQTESIACKEQLRVLSKLVSTGTRLADSIFRSHSEFNEKK
jgi:ppGpp synthetase/RelA/SpoT-type nucleotidyltranferase